MARILYKPLPHQKEFHDANLPVVFLSGGYGSGKTYSLIMKMFQLMNINRNLPGGILCPNIKMFKRDVLPLIDEICEENKINYTFHKTDYKFYFPDTDSTIYVFHGQDEGKSIRGVNLAFMLINEVTLIDEPTYMAARARTRLKAAKLMQLAMSGTPEGFTWHYDYFIEKQRSDTKLIYANSRDNSHLHPSYIGMLEDSYDDLMRQQFIDGKFINMNGKAALWRFDRFKHVVPEIDRAPGLPLWVSLDFNVGNMAATIWQRQVADSPYLLEAIDEIALTHEGADTYDMARAISTKYGTDVIIYPDPAGNAGSSKGKSDIAILIEAGFKQIKYKKKIMSVMDCLNASNALLSKNKIRVSSKCKNFIADAEQCILKSNGEIDKSNIRRSHWLDGFKDMVDYEFPIYKHNSSVKVTNYA